MRGRRIVKWIFAFACTVIAGCGFALAGEGYGLYKNAVQEESLEETVAEIRRQENFTSLEEMPGNLCAGRGICGGSPVFMITLDWT